MGIPSLWKFQIHSKNIFGCRANLERRPYLNCYFFQADSLYTQIHLFDPLKSSKHHQTHIQHNFFLLSTSNLISVHRNDLIHKKNEYETNPNPLEPNSSVLFFLPAATVFCYFSWLWNFVLGFFSLQYWSPKISFCQMRKHSYSFIIYMLPVNLFPFFEKARKLIICSVLLKI